MTVPTVPTAVDLGDAIRRACKEAGITQKQIAEATARDQTTISAWMKGENWPALASLPAIDALCGQARGYILRLAGFVDPDVAVPTAIKQDRQLRPDQQDAVVKVYEAFRVAD